MGFLDLRIYATKNRRVYNGGSPTNAYAYTAYDNPTGATPITVWSESISLVSSDILYTDEALTTPKSDGTIFIPSYGSVTINGGGIITVIETWLLYTYISCIADSGSQEIYVKELVADGITIYSNLQGEPVSGSGSFAFNGNYYTFSAGVITFAGVCLTDNTEEFATEWLVLTSSTTYDNHFLIPNTTEGFSIGNRIWDYTANSWVSNNGFTDLFSQHLYLCNNGYITDIISALLPDTVTGNVCGEGSVPIFIWSADGSSGTLMYSFGGLFNGTFGYAFQGTFDVAEGAITNYTPCTT